MRKGFIEVEGKKIWYSVYGENQKGIPLLAIHGGPGFLTMPQVISDFAADRPVYFYDQLGCGGSDRADDNSFYTVDYYVKELAEVRRLLSLDNVCLIGFSWGTALACLLSGKMDEVTRFLDEWTDDTLGMNPVFQFLT